MDFYASHLGSSPWSINLFAHHKIENTSAAASLLRRLGRVPSHDKVRTGGSPFLNLPGEIRNQIYSEVARSTPLIRLFEGRVVLPALGAVCRQVRKEMRADYEEDVVLDPSKPIVALVTNFNFHHLDRWLNKHSRDLKDKLEAPRLLYITSVLLSPDYTVDTLSPHEPEERRNQQSALDANKNSLCILEHSLETWARTWEAEDASPWFNVETSGIRGLGSRTLTRGRFGPEKISSYIIADRSGTRYAVVWRARTIHRQHNVSHCKPIDNERAGICYRGDFCHHFLLRNMREIRKRAVRDQSSVRLLTWLESATWMYHHTSAHTHDNSFLQMTIHKHDNKHASMFRRSPTTAEQEVVAFYQRLDKLNISRGAFMRELERHWAYRSHSAKLAAKGTKRTFPQYLEDGRPRDGATREHGRGQVRRCVGRRKLGKGHLRIPNRWVGYYTQDLCHDGTTPNKNMALVTQMMEHLYLFQ
jgi:hypothetical protein